MKLNHKVRYQRQVQIRSSLKLIQKCVVPSSVLTQNNEILCHTTADDQLRKLLHFTTQNIFNYLNKMVCGCVNSKNFII